MSTTTTFHCDRCKDQIKKYEDKTAILIGYRNEGKYDVCSSCFKKFVDFMKGSNN